MKEIEIITTITERSYNELSKDERELVDAARKATAGAYAPYSNFRVGAAILLDNGQIVTGANQENAAFPSGTCAERSACFYAGANYPDARFEMIAISAIGPDGLETDSSLRSMPTGAPPVRKHSTSRCTGHSGRTPNHLHSPVGKSSAASDVH